MRWGCRTRGSVNVTASTFRTSDVDQYGRSPRGWNMTSGSELQVPQFIHAAVLWLLWLVCGLKLPCPAVPFPKIGSGSLWPCLVCCKGAALYLMSLWTCTENETHLQPSFHFRTWLGVGCFTSTCVYHMTGFGDRRHFLCVAYNFSVAKHSASFPLVQEQNVKLGSPFPLSLAGFSGCWGVLFNLNVLFLLAWWGRKNKNKIKTNPVV